MIQIAAIKENNLHTIFIKKLHKKKKLKENLICCGLWISNKRTDRSVIKPRVITIFWFLKHKNTLVCELKENNLEQSLCHSVSSLLIVRVSKKKKKKKALKCTVEKRGRLSRNNKVRRWARLKHLRTAWTEKLHIRDRRRIKRYERVWHLQG